MEVDWSCSKNGTITAKARDSNDMGSGGQEVSGMPENNMEEY